MSPPNNRIGRQSEWSALRCVARRDLAKFASPISREIVSTIRAALLFILFRPWPLALRLAIVAFGLATIGLLGTMLFLVARLIVSAGALIWPNYGRP
jgi:hypothetical protein